MFGLKYIPRIDDNDPDAPMPFPGVPIECSDCNLAIVKENLQGKNAILEIGVHRNGDRSFTEAIHRCKAPCAFYLGVDINDKSHLDDPKNHIFTIQCNSYDQVKVRKRLNDLGIWTLDMLIIDGWHSVTMTVNDWKYADLVRRSGVVLLHDTNYHPGPRALYDAVDEEVFTKERLCRSRDDFGIAVFRRLT